MKIDSQKLDLDVRKKMRRELFLHLNLSTRKIENKKRKEKLSPKYKKFD